MTDIPSYPDENSTVTFSDQAEKVMRELAEGPTGPMNLSALDKATRKRLLKMDKKGEVLTRLGKGKIGYAEAALQRIVDLFLEFRERMGQLANKPNLYLAYSAGPEKPKQSDDENGKPEDLPEGHKAE